MSVCNLQIYHRMNRNIIYIYICQRIVKDMIYP